MDEIQRMQGGRGFAGFCLFAGIAGLAAAGACMTVTDPPFCLILGVGSILHIVAGSRGLRGAPPRSTTTLFVIGLVVDLVAIPFWK